MLQELETLASQKQLDDVRVQFEGLRAETAAAHAAQQINELQVALKTQQTKRVEDVAALQQVLNARDAQHVEQLAERESLQTQVSEYINQVRARDLAIKIHEAEHVKKLAASDELLALKHAEYLRENARWDDECLRLTTQLQDLQRTLQQHEGLSTGQEQVSRDQPSSAAGTAREQVSRDQPSAAAGQFRPPSPPPPPPPRISIEELNPPPLPDCWTRAGERWREQWSPPDYDSGW